jgi:hypothetical protein
MANDGGAAVGVEAAGGNVDAGEEPANEPTIPAVVGSGTAAIGDALGVTGAEPCAPPELTAPAAAPPVVSAITSESSAHGAT